MKRGEKMSPEQRAIRSIKAKGNMRAVGHRVTPAQKANLKRGDRPGLGQGVKREDDRGKQEWAA